jgi:1,4-dihydroxy-2-naphthoyl-CoA synthase
LSIDVERAGTVVTVTLNRPEKLNALNPATFKELRAHLDDALTLPLGAYLDAETVRFAECSGSPEAVAAAKAFLGRG